MTRTVLTLGCAAVLFLAYPEARAAAQGAPTPPETKPAAPEVKPAAPEAKPEGEGTKPEDAAPAAPPATPETGAADGEPVSLGDLIRDGFEIRATDFIPAEAVTRHSGKVSSDAIVVTLQKTTATAICFYTLKAYVGKTLTTIPACTVHR
ncbi:MAG: hypothetical protein ACXWVI_08890 [Methyloceanibacter sp.]